MSLSAGTHLGPYTVISLLGAGGMGEVYRARDGKLNRDVALKVLPTELARGPDRLARFKREAQVLAALNHPHIAVIHGFEDSDGIHALVLELVEGPTLADRLTQGPLPVHEALPIARQIAEALDAAHEQGIVHRDLKPANIKVREDGTVKVLDFGLAKALEPGVGSRESGVGNTLGNPLANSPTITSPAMTQAGIILGTAAYMSPEQARGKTVDRRTDIWAFGCVLYEMLSGKRAFEGDEVSDTLAAVLRGEPDWSRLPPDTPPRLRNVVQRCLEKDAKKRLRDIGDVQLALGGAFDVTHAETTARPGFGPRSLVIAAVAGAAVAAVLTSGWWRPRPEPLAPQPVRFSIAPPADYPYNLNPFLRSLAISPDGSRIAYTTGGLGASGQVLIRPIDRLEASPLRGSEGGLFPFFSPDGRSIAFFAEGEIRRVSIGGGPPSTICRYSAAPRGAAWGPDGTIVFATNDVTTGLFSVPADGGEPKTLTTPDQTSGEQDHLLPALSPDGRVVFFTVSSESGVDSAAIAALDLKTGQRRTVVRGGSDATYVDASLLGPPRGSLASAQSASRAEPDGLLVYASAGTLSAVRIDLEGLTALSDPVPVVEQVVMTQTGATQYGLARQGTLVYVSGQSTHLVGRSLEWIARDGRREPIDVPQRPYTAARLSPDETRIALAIADQGSDIWIYDLARRTMTNLTANSGVDLNPIWSPDGQRIVFASSRSGSLQLYSQRADGTGPVVPLTTSAATSAGRIPNSFSPDGRALVFREFAGDAIDLMLLHLDPGPRIEPLLHTAAVEMNGEVSADGRWIAYESSGQVFVRPFPNVEGARHQISIEAGSKPAWSGRGNELFYLDPKTTSIMAVPVQTTGRFDAGAPVKLFGGPWYVAQSGRVHDVSRDGRRFLMIRDAATNGSSTAAPVNLTVVLNWTEELRARLSPNR